MLNIRIMIAMFKVIAHDGEASANDEDRSLTPARASIVRVWDRIL